MMLVSRRGPGHPASSGEEGRGEAEEAPGGEKGVGKAPGRTRRKAEKVISLLLLASANWQHFSHW